MILQLTQPLALFAAGAEPSSEDRRPALSRRLLVDSRSVLALVPALALERVDGGDVINVGTVLHLPGSSLHVEEDLAVVANYLAAATVYHQGVEEANTMAKALGSGGTWDSAIAVRSVTVRPLREESHV